MRFPLLRPVLFPPQSSMRRRLMTLAIETSCDDTSVAIVEKGVQDGCTVARLHFHKKVTSDNMVFQGVHPLISLQSHQENLATLVAHAIQHLPQGESGPRLPDFVSVTRGPGMRSNLFTGLDTAKGLAVAWQRPLVGVHHMQAHALTPRLVAALEAYTDSAHSQEPLQDGPVSPTPDFPFLSVLASGGHTMLIDSTSVTSHSILGTTDDIAVGECLDKVARVILPADELQKAKSTMYGALLENFAFTSEIPLQAKTELQPKTAGYSAQQYLDTFGSRFKWYRAPENNEIAIQRSTSKWGWSINQPLSKTGGGTKIKSMEMSFSGLMTAVERIVRYQTDPSTKKLTKVERTADISIEERKDMAQGVMRAAFEHLSSRVVLGLHKTCNASAAQSAVVMAGGVASNSFLRHV
jgi:N6-L-threonylcarbamoyladenine synthase